VNSRHARGSVFPTFSSRGRAICPERADIFTVGCPSVSPPCCPVDPIEFSFAHGGVVMPIGLKLVFVLIFVYGSQSIADHESFSSLKSGRIVSIIRSPRYTLQKAVL
jgi:hypothetical protein